jgi:hypothetical protein
VPAGDQVAHATQHQRTAVPRLAREQFRPAHPDRADDAVVERLRGVGVADRRR